MPLSGLGASAWPLGACTHCALQPHGLGANCVPPHSEGSMQCLIMAWAHSKVPCSPLGVEEWSRGPRGGESISQL